MEPWRIAFYRQPTGRPRWKKSVLNWNVLKNLRLETNKKSLLLDLLCQFKDSKMSLPKIGTTCTETISIHELRPLWYLALAVITAYLPFAGSPPLAQIARTTIRHARQGTPSRWLTTWNDLGRSFHPNTTPAGGTCRNSSITNVLKGRAISHPPIKAWESWLCFWLAVWSRTGDLLSRTQVLPS